MSITKVYRDQWLPTPVPWASLMGFMGISSNIVFSHHRDLEIQFYGSCIQSKQFDAFKAV